MATTTFGILMDNLGDRLDEELLPAIYAAASVPTAEIRAWMRDAGLPFVDHEAGLNPSTSELDDAADRLVRQARDRAVALGIASGLVGAVAVPPEVLASMVASLRLAQRLAVLHGIDPETDAGKLLLWRAMAAAYDVELPEGMIGMRVRELPDVVRAQLPATAQATAWLARQIALRTLTSVAGRVYRLIPGLGAGIAAFSAYRRTAEMGRKMRDVYRRATEGERFDLGDVEAAVEVGGGRAR